MHNEAVTHLPVEVLARAQAKGLSLGAILALLAKWGPLALQILEEILAHLPAPTPAPAPSK